MSQLMTARRTSLASACWADSGTVEAHLAINHGDIWLGRSATYNAEPLGYADDRHILLVGGNRGGKGTSFILPNILGWPGSLVVADPKGENADVALTRRSEGSKTATGLGQKAYLFDPMRVSNAGDEYRISFNPLMVLEPGSPDIGSEAAELAQALVPSSGSEDASFWENEARTTLKALMLHARTADYIDDEERNLVTVRRLLMEGDYLASQRLQRRSRKKAGEDGIADPFILLWKNVAANRACPLLKGLGTRILHDLVNAPKQYSGYAAMAESVTNFIEDDARMAAALSTTTPGFSLEALKESERGISLFICLPLYEHASQSGLMRLFVTQITRLMAKQNFLPRSGYRVLMMLDEFASLKNLPCLSDGIANLAGYGIKIAVCLQTLEQLQTHYPKHFHTFLANMGAQVYLAVEDTFTCEYVSKMLGETEIVRATRSITLTNGETITTGETFALGHSLSAGTNGSTTETEQSGWSEGRGTSTADGTNGGTSESDSQSTNGGSGSHWGSSNSFGQGGCTSGWNSGKSLQSGWSQTTTNGYSLGWSRQSSTNDNSGQSGGSSHANGSGWQRQDGFNTNESLQSSRAVSRSVAQGCTETLHVRPLLQPHEVELMFKRVGDEENPDYPGLALVKLSGELPFVIRRSNYYDDPCFVGYFDKHPHHPMKQIVRHDVALDDRTMKTLAGMMDAGRPMTMRWLAAPGARMLRGQVIGRITVQLPEEVKEMKVRAVNDGTMFALFLTEGPITALDGRCYAMLCTPKTPRPNGRVIFDKLITVHPSKQQEDAMSAVEVCCWIALLLGIVVVPILIVLIPIWLVGALIAPTPPRDRV